MYFDFKVEGTKVTRLTVISYEQCDLRHVSHMSGSSSREDTALSGQAHWGQERLPAIQAISKATFDSQQKRLPHVYLSMILKTL